MGLQLKDKWLWDFWFAQDGADYHVFYLQAPRRPEDPERRHWEVSIGHAISQDLINWQILPDALRPSSMMDGEPVPFDSYTTWTGSVVRHLGTWYLFYTGGSRAENGLVQRIGFATSNDLVAWQKSPENPVMLADPAWYELLDLNAWHDQAWRDPWVFQTDDGMFHAFITARSKDGPADARGVIGHAQSKDLIHWDILPPVDGPVGEFGHLEVPQVVFIEGRYYLIFSVPHIHYSAARQARLGDKKATGTHYWVADNPLGPYRRLEDDILFGDEVGTLYSGKLIQNPAGEWCFMAFHNMGPDGSFVGTLSDPMPITVHANGRLTVDA